MTPLGSGTPLGLDDEALAACVQCGLCLPHCPTYRVTGDERRSPRGRIALLRAVEWDGATADDEWHEAIDTCVGCLGCETACPSAVPYGRLIADTRAAVAVDHRPPLRLRVGLRMLSWPRLVRWGSRFIGLVQRLGLLRRTGVLPARIPLRRFAQRPVGPEEVGSEEVVLFTGCVMDAWQPEVHAAVVEVLNAAGISAGRSGDRVGCCGSLHEHAGLVNDARMHARRVVDALALDDADTRPILVDSAGCGATLKHYGDLLDTPEARAFAERVFDVHEWCADDPRVIELVSSMADDIETERPIVVVQDPCHLRHVQGCHGAVRDLLRPLADLRELDDEGLCCGAGGAYQVLQPGLARAARDRKVAAVRRTTSDVNGAVLVSANPGCSIHLAGERSLKAAGLIVRHPMEVVADRLRRGVTRTESGREADGVG
ncbi:MAG: (Fe-S)-binding protein [Actinomycetota bacterium]|nr:(Fe-S)-binding protein [Actinomycetota bacterium]